MTPRRAIRRLVEEVFVVEDVSYIRPPLGIVSSPRAKRMLGAMVERLPERVGVSIFMACRLRLLTPA